MIDGNGGDDEREPQIVREKRTWWFQRPSMRTLKAQAKDRAAEFRKDSDRRDNDETRLPPTESVHLGGLVLVEAFTPSTTSGLDQAVKSLLIRSESRENLLASITRSRRGGSSGLHNFSVFRPGVGIAEKGYRRDPELPAGVDAVWLQFNCTVPSLTMVVATFALSEEAGELSSLMRQDYQSKIEGLKVRVFGKFAWLRQRVPWARPRFHGPTYSLSMAIQEKSRACADVIRRHQEACSHWFFDRFPGRFSQADSGDRPVMRLLFTTEQVPFTKKAKWLQPVALERSFNLWRSSEADFGGWFLSLDRWPYNDGRRYVATVAARRTDVENNPIGSQDGATNWGLTYRFGGFQSPLAARYAVRALLAIYSEELGNLRDDAGIKSKTRRTVREAKAIDRYLIGDGLDAATVASDIVALTEDPTLFCWEVPEYVECLDEYRSIRPPSNSVAKPARLLDRIKNFKLHQEDTQNEANEIELAKVLCEGLREQATRLVNDTEATIGNIRASTELRQAIANTKLQRIILVMSIIAILVSIIATAVAIITLKMTAE